MKNLTFVIIILLLVGCNITGDKKSSGDKSDLNNATWISDAKIQPEIDSLFYNDDPAPLFRKEFLAKKGIKSAILYITAAGYYNAFINGEKIGVSYLDPAWTNFSKRIYYSEYDITSKINMGKNCIGVTLGNGFFNPLPMKMWGRLNLRKQLPVGRPVFIAKLKLEYLDGRVEESISDDSWEYSYGPIIKNNIYLGEIYDARKEIKGWNQVGFDDSSWKKALTHKGPGGQLQKAFSPSIQISDTIIPINISSPKKETYIVDMGVNFTGLYNINLLGNPGDTINFRFGERLYKNGELNPMTAVCGQIKKKGKGGAGAPEVAWQTDSYIFGDKTDIWYRPDFTFHIYRYMEISGLKKKPEISNIKGIAFHAKLENENNFSCSSELINSIQKVTRRTFLNNLIGIQSDCPGRERFAYGDDLNCTSESFIYNFNMQAFYRKTVYDWVDAINDSAFIDTAPDVGIGGYCGITSESALLTTQYYLYLYYNDTAIIKELYNIDLKWMDKLAKIHPDGIVDKGFADYFSIGPAPIELSGTCLYVQCARIMGKFASIMRDQINEEKYGKLADEIAGKVLEMYWKKPVDKSINRQTLFATLLYHNIIPENEIGAATDSLLTALQNGISGHFMTGIFATKYILEVLSQANHANSVFDIVNSTNYPGWGFMIKSGATTIWETWLENDNNYSNCHPMFGSVSQWFFRWLGGIRPDPDYPGFKKFIIAPSLPARLNYVKCTYISPYGKIISNWEKNGINNYIFQITVPEGTIASVNLPVHSQQKIIVSEVNSNKAYSPGINKKGYSIFELKPGEYIISVKTGN
jgi:alpha-L-rhamnosidase